jgi:hypothetical protein
VDHSKRHGTMTVEAKEEVGGGGRRVKNCTTIPFNDQGGNKEEGGRG